MKKILIIAALIPTVTFIFTHGSQNTVLGQINTNLTGVILCAPIFGIGYLLYRFHQWHRSFHQRMKKNGVTSMWRTPSA